jgi:hypothetical protein
MPFPTAWNGAQIASYMLGEIENVAAVLEWTASTQPVENAVMATQLAYAADYDVDMTISNAADLVKLHALARREIWRAAVAALPTKYTFSTDGQSFQRSKMIEEARKNFEAAESAAAVFDTSTAPVVGVSTFRYPADPYVYLPDESRVP